jgi:hypothetical protein
MAHRFFRVVILLVWLELGLVLVLVPWSEIWEANYFLYQSPVLALIASNPFVRGLVSGLGVMNVLLSIGTFRRGPSGSASSGGSVRPEGSTGSKGSEAVASRG